MKKIILIILMMHSIPATCAVGCMDTSHYLEQEIDHKDLHYVSCDCACDQEKILKTLGTCLQCNHIHMPREWIIMRGGKQVATTLQYRSINKQDTNSLSDGMQQLLQHMVIHYKKQKQS